MGFHATTHTPGRRRTTGHLRVPHPYDYLGRRVRKVSQERQSDGSWLTVADRLFIYDGWRLLCEQGTYQGNAFRRRYTWGLDLSRTLDGAGGIGGLLAVQQGYPEPDPMMGGPEPLTMGLMSGYGQLNYIYLYDGHGNVGQLLDLTPTTWNAATVMVARYDYDPYGRVLSQLGTFANPDTNGNPFQFSTKYYDHEVGLIYYGYRYYSPRLGRWITRDPLAEEGGVNLYGYVDNAPVNATDPFGLLKLRRTWLPWGFIACDTVGAILTATVDSAVEYNCTQNETTATYTWKSTEEVSVGGEVGAKGGKISVGAKTGREDGKTTTLKLKCCEAAFYRLTFSCTCRAGGVSPGSPGWWFPDGFYCGTLSCQLIAAGWHSADASLYCPNCSNCAPKSAAQGAAE